MVKCIRKSQLDKMADQYDDSFDRCTAERCVDDQHDRNAKRIMGINNARLMWCDRMAWLDGAIERYRSNGTVGSHDYTSQPDRTATHHNQIAQSIRSPVIWTNWRMVANHSDTMRWAPY
jgi:hypothetical protein